jgi:Holliday junction resolvase-like predicted endonuclease
MSEFLGACFWTPIENTLEDLSESINQNKFMLRKCDSKTLARTYALKNGEITLIITPQNTSLKDLRNKMQFCIKATIKHSNGNKLQLAKFFTASEEDAMNSLCQLIEDGYKDVMLSFPY